MNLDNCGFIQHDFNLQIHLGKHQKEISSNRSIFL